MYREQARAILTRIIPPLHENQIPEIRHFMNAIVMQLVRRYPEDTLDLLVKYVGVYDARKQVLTTFVVVACDVLSYFVKRYLTDGSELHKSVCIALVKAILPWTLSYLGSIRSLSQYAVRVAMQMWVCFWARCHRCRWSFHECVAVHCCLGRQIFKAQPVLEADAAGSTYITNFIQFLAQGASTRKVSLTLVR